MQVGYFQPFRVNSRVTRPVFQLGGFFFGAFLEAKEREAWSSKRETKIRSLEVGLGGDRFFRVDVASGNRMKKHSRHYDSAWKNIGISGHYLIGNWFSAGF